MTTLLGNIHALGISDNLTLSGGCALNSAYNGQILDRLPYRALYVPSAPGDDGNAVGAALLGWHRDHPTTPRPPRRQTPYLGTRLKSDAVERLARDGGFARVRQLRGALYDEAARMLADGRLLGWVQGRAEFGPRALGNRSILGDPRSPGMKDLINSRVKFREGFRPFAPSILHEHGPEWFEHYQESPYMERTLRWRAEVADRVPAVVHADRTGRLQSVTLEGNPEFHALISAFYHLTGVPILLNTSFNVMGKPIIHTVEDAASVFVTSGLDGLVIGEYLFEKRGPV